MRLVNLTSHDIVVLTGAKTQYDVMSKKYYLLSAEGRLVIQPSGVVPRCDRREEVVDDLGGIPVYRMTYSGTIGLPAPEPGTAYIVSLQTAQANPGRSDLLIPAHVVHDKRYGGGIVGCLGFSKIG